jgi:RNA polymerase sigma-70 factor (ECF subfamily)
MGASSDVGGHFDFHPVRPDAAPVNAVPPRGLIPLMTGLPFPTAEPPALLDRHEWHAEPVQPEAAFAALVRQYQPGVFRWAMALSGDTDTADDITQEVFVRVHRKLASFRGDGSFEAWLFRITRRVASRTRERSSRRIASADGGTMPDVYVTDPGARVDRERAVALIGTIARTLPMRQREVFLLCDIEGRAPAEAAAMLGMKDVSVRASLFKARSSIRRTILATHPSYTEHPR